MVSRLNRSLLELKAACLNRECWKIQNPRGLHVAREDARLARRLQYTGRGCIPSDVLRKKASEGEGACSPTEARRPHLPLRGKLGWMTPRAGWKQPETDAPSLLSAATALQVTVAVPPRLTARAQTKADSSS